MKCNAILLGLVALFLSSCDAPVETANDDNDFDTCIRGVVTADLGLTTDFQTDLRDFVVAVRPEFTELADINMAYQIALFEASAIQFDFHLRHDRERIQTTAGLSALRNFDWTEEDEGALRSEDAVYEELRQRVEGLKAQNNENPNWPQLREAFNTQLSGQPEYQKMLEDFELRQAGIETMLNACEA